jgi:Ca2+-binding EF-hand superfamily protein
MKSEEPDAHELQIRKTFELFDEDNSGSVDKYELFYAMKMLGKPLSKQEVDSLFENFDVNKDGELNFEEFKKIIAVADNL